MAYNPSKKERNPLILGKSKDGYIWENYATLEHTYDPHVTSAEYPTAVQFEDKIYTVYAFSTRNGFRLAVVDK